MKFVRACPACGSTDVANDISSYIILGSSSFTCNKCGHVSTIFPEVEVSKIKEFQKTIRSVAVKKKITWRFPPRTFLGIFGIFIVYFVICYLLGVTSLFLLTVVIAIIVYSARRIYRLFKA